MVPGVARDGFYACFWMLSGPVLQNIKDAWNDVFTVVVVVPCSVPMILAPWRLLRAASLCFITNQERNAFYRTHLTAKVVYYMRILHDEIKGLTMRACDDCKNGRFLWMQFRVGRFEELSNDAMVSIRNLVTDLEGPIDSGLDAKPEDRRLLASLRIVHLCGSLQDKMFKDRCVLYPDKSSESLTHSKETFSFQDLIDRLHNRYHLDETVKHLSALIRVSGSEFADPESFTKLSADLAAEVGGLGDRLQNECVSEQIEKCLIKLHMCSTASHHSKQVDFEACMDTVIRVQTVTLQSIIKNLPPQPQLNAAGYRLDNFPEREDIRVAFVACFMLSLFDIFVTLTFPLALFRRGLLVSAFKSSMNIASTRAVFYSAFRISFRVFLDGILLLCSLGILISVVAALPFISRMHDAWKSRSLSYARNIIIVMLRDFWKFVCRNLLCGHYNFAILFWSLFLVGFWAGFLPAMIVYVATDQIEYLKKHKLLGCLFTFQFWVSMAVIVPMYGLFINIAVPKVVGSEFGSVVWFLILMILISIVAAIHLSLNRDHSQPVFSAATQRLPTRFNFANVAALFDVILDGIQ
jgi:hypothetical protein